MGTYLQFEYTWINRTDRTSLNYSAEEWRWYFTDTNRCRVGCFTDYRVNGWIISDKLQFAMG